MVGGAGFGERYFLIHSCFQSAGTDADCTHALAFASSLAIHFSTTVFKVALRTPSSLMLAAQIAALWGSLGVMVEEKLTMALSRREPGESVLSQSEVESMSERAQVLMISLTVFSCAALGLASPTHSNASVG